MDERPCCRICTVIPGDLVSREVNLGPGTPCCVTAGFALRNIRRNLHRLGEIPRVARFVEPDVAHHVTQRGVARQVVFRTRGDRVTYLTQLREQAALGGLAVLAYCLMDNHIHLIVVPRDEASMARATRAVPSGTVQLEQL